MRKRRLYRHSISGRAPFHQGHQVNNGGGEEIDWEQQFFERGLQHGMRIASMQQQQLIHAAQQHALALASQTEARIAQARRAEFDRGYSAGMKAAQVNAPTTDSKKTYTYADVEAARARGYSEGRKSMSAAQPNESKIRKSAIDQMLKECQDMAARAPNMAPGPFVNAIKTRMKKLG